MLKAMQKDVPPRPDGPTLDVFLQLWNILRHDLTEFIYDAWALGYLSTRIHLTIVLIPKSLARDEVGD